MQGSSSLHETVSPEQPPRLQWLSPARTTLPSSTIFPTRTISAATTIFPATIISPQEIPSPARTISPLTTTSLSMTITPPRPSPHNNQSPSSDHLAQQSSRRSGAPSLVQGPSPTTPHRGYPAAPRMLGSLRGPPWHRPARMHPPTPLVVEGSDPLPWLGGAGEGWGAARQMDRSAGGTSAGWSPAPQFGASGETG